MLPPKPLIERAYEIAASGDVSSFEMLHKRLVREGYLDVRAHTQGAVLRAKLLKLMKAATVRRADKDQAGDWG